MKRHDELIDSLSNKLEPVKPVRNINVTAMAWVVLSAVFVVAATHFTGPARPGALEQLFSRPRFLIESLLGVLAFSWVGVAAFRAAVPGFLTRPFMITGLALAAAWVAQYIIGLYYPALEPSSHGVRAACYFETVAYALPTTVVAILLARRLYPLRWIRAAMAFGLAAGMMPALYMQIACMYEPVHILTFHVLPGLLMVMVGIGFAVLVKPGSRDRS